MSATQSAALWQRKPALAAMPGPRLRVRRCIIRVFRPRRVDGLPVLVNHQWGRRCRSESRRACKFKTVEAQHHCRIACPSAPSEHAPFSTVVVVQ